MALASVRPTLGKWKWKFPQLAEISESGRSRATLLLEYFRYWFYNVNRRWLIGRAWGRWNFATIEVKCSLSLRMETCFERWWWEIVNWGVSEAKRSDLWVKMPKNDTLDALGDAMTTIFYSTILTTILTTNLENQSWQPILTTNPDNQSKYAQYIPIPHICQFWYTTTLFRPVQSTPKSV